MAKLRHMLCPNSICAILHIEEGHPRMPKCNGVEADGWVKCDESAVKFMIEIETDTILGMCAKHSQIAFRLGWEAVPDSFLTPAERSAFNDEGKNH